MPGRWVERLLLAYAAALTLRRLVYLPGVGSKLQVPELIFLLLAPLGVWTAGRRLWPGWNALTAGLSGLFVVGLLSAGRTWSRNAAGWGSLLEAAGRGYLFLLLLLVAWYVSHRREGPDRLLRAWNWGCVAMALVGYLGYGLGLAGIKTKFVILYENYPYFGTVLRAASTAGWPALTVLVALLPVLWQWRRWRQGRGGGWFLVLLLPLLVLTLAKEILLLGLGLWLVDSWVRRRSSWLRYGPVVAGSLAFWFVTHYLVEPPRTYAEADLRGVVYTGGRVAARGEGWQLTETTYLALKRANWRLAVEHPWLGVGPDATEGYLPDLKRRGVYPDNLPVYRPHSTYFGVLAETGWPGFGCLFLTVVGLGRVVRYNSRRLTDDGVTVCLTAFFFLVSVAALCEEFLALRFVYLAAGIALGQYVRLKAPPHAV